MAWDHQQVAWARDPSASFLLSAAALRACIEVGGVRELVWEERPPAPPPTDVASTPAVSILHVVMGDQLAAIQAAAARNDEEGRIARIHAVFERP